MEDLHSGIKELQLAIQMLLKKYASLKTENEQLKKLNSEMQATLQEKEKLITNAQEKLAANNVSDLYDPEDKKFLQAKIDLYLKDIEKCLDLLNASPWKS
jgi:chromosome segregation ATPase